jgi:hypothetical protein
LDRDADIKVQARMGWQVACYVVVFGSCCLIGWYWPDARPFAFVGGVADIVAAAVFIRLNWDILVLGDVSRCVIRERTDETQPVTDPQVLHVKAELKEGRQTLYDELDITNYPAWHEFCKAVVEGRNFSQSESERHKVPPSDWDTVSTEWTRRGWLKQTGRRKTPELRPQGRAWVKAYATTPPNAEGR